MLRKPKDCDCTFTSSENIAIGLFKAFCEDQEKLRMAGSASDLDSHFDELDWYALSIGFFCALGIRDENTLSKLSLHVRYHAHYWC